MLERKEKESCKAGEEENNGFLFSHHSSKNFKLARRKTGKSLT